MTSAAVLGLLWYCARTTSPVPAPFQTGLLAGWILMPTILGLSLHWPRLRYALIVPAFLVSVSLLGICFSALPQGRIAWGGWVLVTMGVFMGGVQGIWFWFRWLPVPRALEAPFSRGRWSLIGIHISLIVAGLIFLALPHR